MGKLDDLEKLEREATPGPWYPNGYGKEADGALLVAARNALPALLRVARAAKAYRDEQDAGFGEGCNHVDRLAHLAVELDAALAVLDASETQGETR